MNSLYIRNKVISHLSPSVVVFGAINIDLLATAGSEALVGDSTPGTLRQFFGGVGRNIAENLARLGISTKLVSAVGNDGFASDVIAHASAAGIGTCYIEVSDNFPTASYTAIHNQDGELLHAVSDMRLFDQLNVTINESMQAAILNADAIVIDANLKSSVIEEIVRHCESKLVVADAVSTKKSVRLSSVLGSIDLLKVNRAEACALAHMEHNVGNDELMQAMLALGPQELLATAGHEGAFLLSKKQTIKGVPGIVPDIVSTNGAGDALLSAVLASRLYGFDKSDQVAWGLATAAHTLSVEAACADNLSYELILQKVREQKQ